MITWGNDKKKHQLQNMLEHSHSLKCRLHIFAQFQLNTDGLGSATSEQRVDQFTFIFLHKVSTSRYSYFSTDHIKLPIDLVLHRDNNKSRSRKNTEYIVSLADRQICFTNLRNSFSNSDYYFPHDIFTNTTNRKLREK